MEDVDEALEQLEDARVMLDRYNRMLRWFGIGAAGGTGAIIVVAVLNSAHIASAGVTDAVSIPAVLLALACAVGFICRVALAQARDYGGPSQHPADKLREAERTYNRALRREAERG